MANEIKEVTRPDGGADFVLGGTVIISVRAQSRPFSGVSRLARALKRHDEQHRKSIVASNKTLRKFWHVPTDY
ncbi:MAG: hypothetical protein ACAH17_01335 [Candidatus Paceibacterota bacterium]